MLGKEMGYAGIELREWVSTQMKAEEKKEAAALEREDRRIKREEQQRDIAARAQEELSAREAERAEREAERVTREAERAERIRMDEMAVKKTGSRTGRTTEDGRALSAERNKVS